MKKIIMLIGLATVFAAPAQVPNYVPTTGLLGYWPFTGNANDVSGNLNNGTVNGASLVNDRFNSSNAAYSFNGTSDYILVPNSPVLSGFSDMSISAWVNLNSFNWIQNIVAKWDQQLDCGNYSDTYSTAFLNNQLHWNTNNNNVALFAAPPTFTSSDLNQWKHFVFTSSSTLGEAIYVNGVLMATNNTTGGICNSTNPVYFGAGYDGNQNSVHRFLDGKLDDIGIWNRVLNTCEIMQLYTASALSLSLSSSAATLCAGKQATISANGASTYTWSNSLTGPAIVVNPITTTSYTVTGTNTLTGCSKTLSLNQVVSECTSLYDNENRGQVKIYPNPVTDVLNIDLKALNPGIYIINALDITGARIFKQDLNHVGQENFFTIDLGGFESGCYLIKLTDIDGKHVITRKVILKN